MWPRLNVLNFRRSIKKYAVLMVVINVHIKVLFALVMVDTLCRKHEKRLNKNCSVEDCDKRDYRVFFAGIIVARTTRHVAKAELAKFNEEHPNHTNKRRQKKKNTKNGEGDPNSVPTMEIYTSFIHSSIQDLLLSRIEMIPSNIA